MAFEDLYSETETVSVGGDYWISIKSTLTYDEKERADKHMHRVQATVDDRGKMHGVVSPDYEGYRREMVAASVVSWNLDERDGSTWQLSPPSAKIRNVGRLPGPVFDAVFKRVEALNAIDATADRSFRAESVSGDQDGVDRAADSPTVLVGDEAVDTVGDTSEAVGR